MEAIDLQRVTLLTLACVVAAAAMAIPTKTTMNGVVGGGKCPDACRCATVAGKNATICQAAGLTAVPSGLAERTNFLDMSGNRIEVLVDDEFRSKGVIAVEAIVLDGSGVKEVRPKAFAGLKWLKQLDLSDNSIVSLDRFVFADNKLLEMVNLSGNAISALVSFQFTALPMLKRLDFSNCAISVVESEAFSNLLFLENLSLRNNSLSTLPRDSFTWLKELKRVDLRDNPWQCDCDVRSLVVLFGIRRLDTDQLSCYNAADNSTTPWQGIDTVDADCVADVESSVKENLFSLSERLHQQHGGRFSVMDTGKKLFSSPNVESSLLPTALMTIAVVLCFLGVVGCYAKCRSLPPSIGLFARVWSICCWCCCSCCCCFDFCRSDKKYNRGAGGDYDDDDYDGYDFERTCYSNFDQDCSDISLTVEL